MSQDNKDLVLTKEKNNIDEEEDNEDKNSFLNKKRNFENVKEENENNDNKEEEKKDEIDIEKNKENKEDVLMSKEKLNENEEKINEKDEKINDEKKKTNIIIENDNKKEEKKESTESKLENIVNIENKEKGEIINNIDELEEKVEIDFETIINPLLKKPLVTFDLFSQIITLKLNQKQLKEIYEKYRSTYDNYIKEIFFQEHKEEEWFKEEFHPFYIPEIREVLNEEVKKLYSKFQRNLKQIENKIKLELIEEDLKNTKIQFYIYSNDENQENFTEQTIKDFSNPKENIEINNKNYSNNPYYIFDKDKRRIKFHSISKNNSITEILKYTKETNGFEFISISFPLRDQDYSRFCFLYYDSEENTKLAFEKIQKIILDENHNFYIPEIILESNIKIRITPPLFDERIKEDLIYTKKIIEVFDKNFNINNNIIFDDEKNRNCENQLDIQILYLRRVHGFCFYCLKKYNNEGILSLYCDDIHLRNNKRIGKRNLNNNELIKEINFDKFFTKNIELFIKSIPDKKKIIFENKIIPEVSYNKMVDSYLEFMCEMKTDNLCECKGCGKNFLNKNYYKKHFENFEKNRLINDINGEILENAEKQNFLNYERPKEFMIIKIINSKNDFDKDDESEIFLKKHYNKYIDFDDPDNFKETDNLNNLISYENL